MSDREFIVWLFGFRDLMGNSVPTEDQWKVISEQLSKIQKEKYSDAYTLGSLDPSVQIITC